MRCIVRELCVTDVHDGAAMRADDVGEIGDLRPAGVAETQCRDLRAAVRDALMLTRLEIETGAGEIVAPSTVVRAHVAEPAMNRVPDASPGNGRPCRNRSGRGDRE